MLNLEDELVGDKGATWIPRLALWALYEYVEGNCIVYQFVEPKKGRHADYTLVQDRSIT